MTVSQLPSFIKVCTCSEDDALRRVVRSGRTIASGFATSEPHSFYRGLWEFIQRQDVHDLEIRQALFMAPHPICVGDAPQAAKLLSGWDHAAEGIPLVGEAASKALGAARKLAGVKRLVSHYEALERRRITFTSAFIGAATNVVVPDTGLTRRAFAAYAGRNTTRMGITHMHSAHFADGADAVGYDADGNPRIDAFVLVLTPPNEDGEMSHGPANGANGDVLRRVLAERNFDVLLYLNAGYPFTRGWRDAPNTVHVGEFEALAREGRLMVVHDDAPVPSVPRGALSRASQEEKRIAEHVVNHIEMNLRYTAGRAIQVGIGGTGVQAIKGLASSSWTGRCYTEMLEPYTFELFESGKVTGSHFIGRDGCREQVDGKVVATFAMCEEGSGFYGKLHNHPGVVLAPASRVVISEGFYYGLGINNCLAIDFHGHVNSGARDRNHHSGVGGGAMIHRGLARGGVAYLCLKSTHRTPEGELRSSIFPYLPRGTAVSLIGPDITGGREGARFFLVTEHGVAQLSGKSQHELIRSLISVADPRFRDELAFAARREFRVAVGTR